MWNPVNRLQGRLDATGQADLTGITVSTSNVTQKGQVTIPVEIRRALGLKTGSKYDSGATAER